MTTTTATFEYCALCGDSLEGALDGDTGVCQHCMDAAPEPGAQREMLPDEVFAADAEYVALGVKTMTARRMVGWLRGYADYCDFAENTTTATHARTIANRLAAEVESESVQPIDLGGSDEEGGGER